MALLCASVVVFAYESNEGHRSRYNFNSGWKLFVGDPAGAAAPEFDDSAWKDVTLPRAWNEDDAFKKDIKDLSTGIAWYRKRFRLPADSAGRKVFLEFEGIRQGGEFYLNGKLIGRHENGITAFGFDVTDLLKPAPQENVLAARIDNSWSYKEKATGSAFQWNDRNFYANYGGINKNVFLHITDKLHQTLPLYSNLKTTGVYVYVQDFSIRERSATVTAESQVRNEYAETRTFSYEVVIEDMGGRVVKRINGGKHTLAPGETKTFNASAKLSGLNFWSWGYGYLYNVNTILKVDGRAVDVVTTRTGFRKTEFAGGVVKLNDRVIIRSTTKAGKVVLTASADGLKSSSVEIVSRPVRVEGGLSMEMPDAGLVSNLDRGPTPAGPSFKVSRRAVKIARVAAGANDGQAARSFDDDETTNWSSDGKLTDAWIKYDFSHPARVGEVTMKLVGWRTQSYPIRILVGDQEVFAGNTPRSLGYVTFTFTPVTGESLKVELTGSASNRDAFGNIIEIPGTPDPQSAAGKGGAKNSLGIVEIEIYEPVAGSLIK